MANWGCALPASSVYHAGLDLVVTVRGVSGMPDRATTMPDYWRSPKSSGGALFRGVGKHQGKAARMTRDVIEKRQDYLTNPTPGDYWNEMMVPVLLVLAVNARGVHVITDTVDLGDGWMWDFDKARTISMDDFKETVRHCYCYHKSHGKAVGWWKEHIGIE